ncbi:MAG: cell division inhibitor SulA [Pseudohongiellaceae bacterium]|jgi:cell division inhibitor SulA
MRQLSMYESYGGNHFDMPDYFAEAKLSEHHYQKPALVELNTKKNSKTDTHEANVTEIILTKDKADCIQLLLPMLTHLNQDQRWLAWVDPPIQLLKQWGQEHDTSATEDIMILRSNDNYSAFELTDKALNAGTCHAVIVWTDKQLSNEEFYKLESASSKGDSHGIILRYR